MICVQYQKRRFSNSIDIWVAISAWGGRAALLAACQDALGQVYVLRVSLAPASP